MVFPSFSPLFDNILETLGRPSYFASPPGGKPEKENRKANMRPGPRICPVRLVVHTLLSSRMIFITLFLHGCLLSLRPVEPHEVVGRN
ncbi:hypothetical protein I7I53_11837 [Histoplasma capsulatum var. duboisii H88]|uniref:Uncharacterized protein n=1 Tax=Ajellomyces capsulatus (strain H88) TaxID=544711 RepID=A0A8A1LWJ7_AJEC8|nr:hypothetical protein I7I53_11837 [Histoplasma capsulatum var. duboisii H88]